jgi:hypothetical protein
MPQLASKMSKYVEMMLTKIWLIWLEREKCLFKKRRGVKLSISSSSLIWSPY